MDCAETLEYYARGMRRVEDTKTKADIIKMAAKGHYERYNAPDEVIAAFYDGMADDLTSIAKKIKGLS